jgi:hypothetical protein
VKKPKPVPGGGRMVFALARVMVLSVNRTCGIDCEGIGGRNEGFKAFEYVKSRSISGHRPVRRGIRVNCYTSYDRHVPNWQSPSTASHTYGLRERAWRKCCSATSRILAFRASVPARQAKTLSSGLARGSGGATKRHCQIRRDILFQAQNSRRSFCVDLHARNAFWPSAYRPSFMQH